MNKKIIFIVGIIATSVIAIVIVIPIVIINNNKNINEDVDIVIKILKGKFIFERTLKIASDFTNKIIANNNKKLLKKLKS